MINVKEPEKYTRLYQGFRGVDFSSDHTLVAPNRLAYAINMYKDYKSSQGQAIETFVGFDKAVVLPLEGETTPQVYKIFPFIYTSGETKQTSILIHAGKNLYEWKNYPYSVNIEKENTFVADTSTGSLTLSTEAEEIISVYVDEVELPAFANVEGELVANYTINAEDKTVVDFLTAQEGDITIKYYEGVIEDSDSLYSDMNEAQSHFIIFNNICYIVDGKTYLMFDGSTVKKVDANSYTPTTYINRIPGKVEIKSVGTQLEQRNNLSPYFKNTFIAPTPETFTLGISLDNYTSEGITASSSTVTQEPTDTLKQIATLICAGSISTAGKAKMVVESYLFIDEQETIFFDVELSDSPDIVAEKAITALKENAIISKYYDISGAITNVILTAKNLAEIVKTYHLSEASIESIESIKIYGEAIVNPEAPEDPLYTVDLTNGVVTFATAPTRPQDNDFPIDHAGIEITAKKARVVGTSYATEDLINKCTIMAVYDNRVFFSGNPDYPNEVYHTMLDDAGYVGELCFFPNGKGQAIIKGLMVVADTLTVIKADTQQDAAVYYRKGVDTGSNYNPRVYPGEGGLSGLGCLSGYTNFLDDPVFISRLGLEAIGQLSVRLERAIEHRSSMVDGLFVNEDLTDCILEEWNGYLICMVNGKFYMADSRQVYMSPLGTKEYEWYYIEGIGLYENQYQRYDYATKFPDYFPDKVYIGEEELTLAPEELLKMPANYALENGEPEYGTIEEGFITINEMEYSFNYIQVVDKYYLVERKPDLIGGQFKKATALKEHMGNIIFGTENGTICTFHFDKRTEGEIPTKYYSFDGRAIICGLATVFDNCGVPNMLKTTAKKSLVIKCKTLPKSSLKIKVRTNKSGYRLVGEINNGYFSFDDIDFADLTFNTSDQQIFAVNEREKKWAEKQLFLFSDDVEKPFALYYFVYQYYVVGRIK